MILSVSVKELSILDEIGVPLVRNVSFSIQNNEIFFLVGETGSGKTLITQAIAGTLPKRLSTRGEVLFKGRDLLKLSEKQWKGLWGRSLFIVPQEPFAALNPFLSVSRQVEEVFIKVRSMDRRWAKEAAKEILASLDISPSISSERPGKLSGGMAQRVLLAIALASPAKFIILDEPTKGLDSLHKKEATFLMEDLLKARKTLLCITHDLTLPLKMGGRIGVLFGGILVESGFSSTLLRRPSHPYTQGLLNALPERGLKPIPEELLKELERAWII